jgi:hypothetical protein
MLTSVQGGGIQDVKFIPGNPESAALATAVHLGQVVSLLVFRVLSTFVCTKELSRVSSQATVY